jgi:hypothetical protein
MYVRPWSIFPFGTTCVRVGRDRCVGSQVVCCFVRVKKKQFGFVFSDEKRNVTPGLFLNDNECHYPEGERYAMVGGNTCQFKMERG